MKLGLELVKTLSMLIGKFTKVSGKNSNADVKHEFLNSSSPQFYQTNVALHGHSLDKLILVCCLNKIYKKWLNLKKNKKNEKIYRNNKKKIEFLPKKFSDTLA